MNESSKATDSVSIKTGKGFKEGLYLDVNMHLELRDEFGNLKEERFVHNTVTTAGKQDIADQLLASPTTVKPGWMAIGTGGTPTATLLQTEIARVALTSKTRSGAVVTMVGDFPAGTGTGSIVEAGIFNVVTANTVDMYCSAAFSAINKGAADSLSISWALTIS